MIHVVFAIKNKRLMCVCGFFATAEKVIYVMQSKNNCSKIN